MNTTGKKSIRQIEMRKPIAVSRLIKCYVCNHHFQTQKQFDLHLQQHQNKFTKNTIQEIQRKTQQSFRSKKSVPSLNKTQVMGQQDQQLSTLQTSHKPSFSEKEEDLDENEQKQIEQALKESQILLEKIEFMTQISQPQQQKTVQVQNQEDLQYIQKWIQNERQLHTHITKAQNKASIEKLILETHFQEKYFENYQEQLLHLRLLASVAINPVSVAKVIEIRRNICRDVCNQLEKHFSVQEQKAVENHKKLVEKPKLGENNGDLKICVDCYGNIGGTDEYYSLSCGHCYHLECWNGECCG